MSLLSQVQKPTSLQVKSVQEVFTPNMGKYILKNLIDSEEKKLVFINQVNPKASKNLNGARAIASTIDWNELHTYTDIKKADISYTNIGFFNSEVRNFVLDKVEKTTFNNSTAVAWGHVSLEYFSEAEYLSHHSSETNLYTKNGKLTAKSEVALYAHQRNKGALITLVRRGKDIGVDNSKIAGYLPKIQEKTSISTKKYSFSEVTNNFTVSQHFAEFVSWKQDIYKLPKDNFYITDLKDSAGRNVVVFIEEHHFADQSDKDKSTKPNLTKETSAPKNSNTNSSNSTNSSSTMPAQNQVAAQVGNAGNTKNTKNTENKSNEQEAKKLRGVYYLDRSTGELSLITKDYARPTVYLPKNTQQSPPTKEELQEDSQGNFLQSYFNIFSK